MDPVASLKASFISLMAILASGGCLEIQGQVSASLRVEENLRAEPRGAVIGRLAAGSVFPVITQQDLWVQVEVEGWIWAASVQTTDRGGFDLMVSAAPTENLRAQPRGEVLGVLAEGALLEELADTTGWRRVRRRAWVWRESLDVGAREGGPPGPTGGEEVASTSEWWRSGVGGTPLLSVPDGDTLARAHPGAEFQVLAREGNWVRVRLEAWAWAPGGESLDPSEASAPSSATPEDVARDPDSFRGRVVSWNLQFVSLERAEKIRTDFYEGEPFLLARTTASGGSFVYVAVPPERLGELEGLIPLERIQVTGRIRTGSAALTGNPILDLLEIRRVSRD